MAVATDFAIDLGFVMAGVIALIVLVAYNQRVSVGVWRVSFGLGFVLPLGLLFFRLRLVNSTQYRKHAMKQKIPYLLVIKKYWKPMLGTSLAWFFYDFVVREAVLSQLSTDHDRHIHLVSSARPSSALSTQTISWSRTLDMEQPSTVSIFQAACLEDI